MKTATFLLLLIGTAVLAQQPPVVKNTWRAVYLNPLRTVLLSLGMAAVFVYVLHIILGGILWPEYSQLQQPISDLTATGAPNRHLLLVLTTTYGVLSLLFALTFLLTESRRHHRLVFWGAITFVMLHIISIAYGAFPEDMPGRSITFAGTMHIVITALIVPFTIGTPFLIGFGFLKEPDWRTVGYLSILAGVLIMVCGSATAVFYANKWPYFGLVERANIGVLQLWTFYFSLKLARVNRKLAKTS